MKRLMDQLLCKGENRRLWLLTLVVPWVVVGGATFIFLRSWVGIADSLLLLIFLVWGMLVIATSVAAFGPSRFRRLMIYLWVVPTFGGLFELVRIYEYELSYDIPPFLRAHMGMRAIGLAFFIFGLITLTALANIEDREMLRRRTDFPY
jgi:hypothetical protein